MVPSADITAPEMLSRSDNGRVGILAYVVKRYLGFVLQQELGSVLRQWFTEIIHVDRRQARICFGINRSLFAEEGFEKLLWRSHDYRRFFFDP